LPEKLEQKEGLKVCEIPGEKNKYCKANKYCRSKDVEKKDFISLMIFSSISTEMIRADQFPTNPDRDSQYKNWEKGGKRLLL
jgi:hypothetical protein